MLQSPLPAGKAFAIVNAQGRLAAPGERKHGYVVFDKGQAHCFHLDAGCVTPLSPAQARAIFTPAKPAAPKFAPKKTVAAINFSELPEAIGFNLRCPNCGETQDNTIVRTLTDEGEKEVGMCSSCDALFRPWKRPFSESVGLSGSSSVISINHSPVKPAASRTKRTTQTGRKNAVKNPKKIIFSKLVRAQSRSQECFFCEYEPNYIRKMNTDEGPKMLVQCEECDAIMRPFAK